MQPYTSRGRPQKKPSERDVCTQFRHNVRTKQSISTVFPPDAPFHSFIFFRGGNLNLFPDARRDPIGRGFLCGSREFIDFEKKKQKDFVDFQIWPPPSAVNVWLAGDDGCACTQRATQIGAAGEGGPLQPESAGTSRETGASPPFNSFRI